MGEPGIGFDILKKRRDGSAQRVHHTGASSTLAVIDFDLDIIVVVLAQVPQTQTLCWRREFMETIQSMFEDKLIKPNNARRRGAVVGGLLLA